MLSSKLRPGIVASMSMNTLERPNRRTRSDARRPACPPVSSRRYEMKMLRIPPQVKGTGGVTCTRIAFKGQLQILKLDDVRPVNGLGRDDHVRFYWRACAGQPYPCLLRSGVSATRGGRSRAEADADLRPTPGRLSSSPARPAGRYRPPRS